MRRFTVDVVCHLQGTKLCFQNLQKKKQLADQGIVNDKKKPVIRKNYNLRLFPCVKFEDKLALLLSSTNYFQHNCFFCRLAFKTVHVTPCGTMTFAREIRSWHLR